MSQIRILVVDDFEPWRRRVSSRLAARPEFQVVGEASCGLEALLSAKELKPDIILLDIGLPDLNGIEVSNQLHQLVPSAQVIFVSQNNDVDIVQNSLSDGARGYVLKTDAGNELLPAIEAIFRGEKFVSSGLATLVERRLP
jgi:DNA-binding NarL/FixJ family response regulator